MLWRISVLKPIALIEVEQILNTYGPVKFGYYGD